jgi:hypothetical protein
MGPSKSAGKSIQQKRLSTSTGEAPVSTLTSNAQSYVDCLGSTRSRRKVPTFEALIEKMLWREVVGSIARTAFSVSLSERRRVHFPSALLNRSHDAAVMLGIGLDAPKPGAADSCLRRAGSGSDIHSFSNFKRNTVDLLDACRRLESPSAAHQWEGGTGGAGRRGLSGPA